METKKPNNPSAFPQNPAEQLLDKDLNIIDDGKGMSLRDYFAGKAITLEFVYMGSGHEEETAKRAYKLADAMLKERLK